MSILSAENITKKYGAKTILENVSFCVEPGSFIAIVGTNGCGKTTLLNILSGVSPATSGTIYINGTRASHKSSLYSKNIGFVPQDNPLFHNLTVLDNLRFWYCDSQRNPKEDLKNGLAAAFGLTSYAGYPVSRLSGGLKRRLSIVCALAQEPPVLILDEPTAALDLVCKNEIHQYLLEYKRQGGTIILTSHEDTELGIADTMYLLKDKTLNKLEHPLTGASLVERLNNV